MKFAKYTFYAAGIYGLLVLLPQFFLLEKTGRDYPPAITHPEYFYGFASVAAAFQIVFLIIGSDPVRYRTLMLAALAEKFPFALIVALLYFFGSVPLPIVGGAAIDLVLGILFLIAYLKTPRE
ncbi:MAG TPA: hypothetical protein VIL74_24130 [Pyrinomonadaceae bacterium]|jgi:hypothetical protein